MEPSTVSTLKQWFSGQKGQTFSFDDLCNLFVLRIADRITDNVDEVGQPIDGTQNPYFYNLRKIAADDAIPVEAPTLRRVAAKLVDNGWAERTKGSTKVALTESGWEKAQEINDAIFNSEEPDKPSEQSNADVPFVDWLIVYGYRAFDIGHPVAKDGMVDFRKVADGYVKRVSDSELDSSISQLERNDLILRDRGPAPGTFWAYFNTGGVERATLLEEIWAMRKRVPASNRFIRLDDNAPQFQDAVSRLQELIIEANEIRVNDWPEKEGMLATLNGALGSLKTKYVNKAAILAAVTSVTTFLAIKFAEAPIAELAQKTWTAIKNIF